MRTRLVAFILIAIAGSAAAAPMTRSYRSEQKFTLSRGGSLVLENPVGNVFIVGSDSPNIEATVFRTITAQDKTMLEEARKQTVLIVGGDEKLRILRTVGSPEAAGWTMSVAWKVRMPRSAHVRVLSRTSDQISVSGMTSVVQVRNFNGSIHLTDNAGPVVAESVNGTINYQSQKPAANVILSTVNGNVLAVLPRDADFRWVAKTVKGDIKTNLPARGAFFGTTFRGSVNAPGGPTLSTTTLMGNVDVIGLGMDVATSVSLRKMAPEQIQRASTGGPRIGARAGAVERQSVRGFFRYETNLGDVRIQEIDGAADIFTGAGEVQLGAVAGTCVVRSNGGPLQLGEIFGQLKAETRAGDILVDSARSGGTLYTNGGTIRLLYAGGPTNLGSGGGDIVVRQAAAPIEATTKSGDIAISVDERSKSQRISAKTDRGNIVIHVKAGFGADIDATIITDKPNVDTIVSELGGLSMTREPLGGKLTRVRAVGKVNGGGEKITLQATSGDIRITTRGAGPTVVGRQ